MNRQARTNNTIDDLDLQIIRLLQKNARAPNTELARALDVTETTVRKRVARLLDEDLITIVAVPSERAAGVTMSSFLCLVVQPQELQNVARELSSFQETRYVGFVAGRYQIIVEALFSNDAHVMNFTTDCVGRLSGVVSVEMMPVFHVAKFGYEWEI